MLRCALHDRSGCLTPDKGGTSDRGDCFTSDRIGYWTVMELSVSAPQLASVFTSNVIAFRPMVNMNLWAAPFLKTPAGRSTVFSTEDLMWVVVLVQFTMSYAIFIFTSPALAVPVPLFTGRRNRNSSVFWPLAFLMNNDVAVVPPAEISMDEGG